MQYLTPSEIKKVAPAIIRLSPPPTNLIDTSRFLQQLESQGYRPLAAVQGTSHVDAESKNKGRHLAIAGNRAGNIIAILNSHTVWRRAWLGYGHWLTEAGGCLIGPVLPLARWKGTEETLQALMTYQDAFKNVFDGLATWRPELHQMRWMAKKMASTAYLPGHKTPLAKALQCEAQGTSALGVLHLMLMRIKEGGLPPDGAPIMGTLKRRKLKPVAAPDALFRAYSTAFRVGLAALNKYQGGYDIAFPALDNRTAPKT